MTQQERQAWLVLSVFGLSLLIFLIVTVVFGFHWKALPVFLLVVIADAIGSYLSATDRALMEQRDERVFEIKKISTLAGSSVVNLITFLAVCLIPLLYKGPDGKITISATFPFVLWLGMNTIEDILRSLFVVLMHRRGIHGQAE